MTDYTNYNFIRGKNIIKLPRRPKLEGDARIEYGIINLMQNKGYYKCRLVKTLINGAKVFQMMDKKDHPCSCIWAQADEENWVKVSETATKDDAIMIDLYELSLETNENKEPDTP